ncbi:MAG: myb/SANT-like DNA-binding domain-containing protein [Gammaproteobacteria bacterium]|nr:myb/SANT-like DNA-binding domain-containing protein [Gammaproteobacteria bacterium]
MSIVWPVEATFFLIRLRRNFQVQFELAANRDHAAIWANISSQIIISQNFFVTGRQCQIKWQALKSEYENASRILNGNHDGHEIRSPNRYDRIFYQEMSDEFWLSTGNY